MESFNNKVETGLTSPESEAFMTKLAERSKSLLDREKSDSLSGRLLRAGTLAATMTVAACSGEDAEKQNFDQASTYSQTDTGISEKDYLEARRQRIRDRLQESQLKTEETITEAKQTALELGIDTSSGLNYTQEGLVITEINGVEVPSDYHTPAEQEQIKQARQMRDSLTQPEASESTNRSTVDSSFIDPSEF